MTLSLNHAPKTASLQWGRRYSATEITLEKMVIQLRQYELQWGRRYSATEMLGLWWFDPAQSHASMGPSLFSDGNIRSRNRLARAEPASMGPSLFSDGNALNHTDFARCKIRFNGAVAIQRRKSDPSEKKARH